MVTVVRAKTRSTGTAVSMCVRQRAKAVSFGDSILHILNEVVHSCRPLHREQPHSQSPSLASHHHRPCGTAIATREFRWLHVISSAPRYRCCTALLPHVAGADAVGLMFSSSEALTFDVKQRYMTLSSAPASNQAEL